MSNVPTWAAILAGLGFGTIITKILDIWMVKQRQKIEFKTWLRQNRLEAFTELSKDLLSLGFDREDRRIDSNEDFWISVGNASRAILLLEDDELNRRIRKCMASISSYQLFKQVAKILEQEGEDNKDEIELSNRMYVEAHSEADNIVKALRDIAIMPTRNRPLRLFGRKRKTNDSEETNSEKPTKVDKDSTD